jgi:hypothetical protein
MNAMPPDRCGPWIPRADINDAQCQQCGALFNMPGCGLAHRRPGVSRELLAVIAISVTILLMGIGWLIWMVL